MYIEIKPLRTKIVTNDVDETLAYVGEIIPLEDLELVEETTTKMVWREKENKCACPACSLAGS